MPLVLDTNVVRSLGVGEIDPEAFRRLHAEGVSIHLPETCLIELLLQLREGRFPWDKWLRARRVLGVVLSHQEPISMGRDFAGKRHPFGTPRSQGHAADNPESQLLIRRLWKSIVRADTPSEIGAGVRSGKRILPTINSQRLAEELAFSRNTWISELQRLYVLPRVSHRDAHMQFDGLVERLARSVDEEVSGEPPESIRWDALIRVMAWYSVRSLTSKGAYDVEKHANDAIDVPLLRYLAVPSAICTRDRRLLAAPREAHSWQAGWVVSPEDILDPVVRKRLVTLAWPSEMPRAAPAE
jgi:hypothetical protein